MINMDLADSAVVDFNRRVLRYDLRRMKKNMVKLNDRIVDNLDNYFDTACELAAYDAGIFKAFFRKMLKKNKLTKI